MQPQNMVAIVSPSEELFKSTKVTILNYLEVISSSSHVFCLPQPTSQSNLIYGIDIALDRLLQQLPDQCFRKTLIFGTVSWWLDGFINLPFPSCFTLLVWAPQDKHFST